MVKVYIIDDEETIQYLYKEGLALEGHEIIGTAYNGHQALQEMVKLANYPDVIIIDHRMPIKNGLDTLKEMYFQEMPETTKILFITADPTVREEASKLGVSHFIQKPFSILKLAKMITELFT
ncbi:MAG: response regulator [Candidatus Heimdallarchaeota archaeon]|nr:response regulator [Candidatus Heimdallarchaeota archaeon]